MVRIVIAIGIALGVAWLALIVALVLTRPHGALLEDAVRLLPGHCSATPPTGDRSDASARYPRSVVVALRPPRDADRPRSGLYTRHRLCG
jgi:hypothetical protein